MATATRTHDKTAEHAWIRLMRVYHHIARRTATVMRNHDLSVSRFDVLNHVGAREGRTQQELADALFVTKGNICQLLDAMEADQLLFRRRQGRENHIYLTAAGNDLRQRTLADQQQLIDTSFEALTATETDQLLHLLRKLDRHLDTQEG